MIIYQVGLSVDREIADKYERWLGDHIVEVIAIDGFIGAEWFEIVDEESERREYVVQYRLRDREALESYFRDHADRMRREGTELFGGRYAASRRIMELRRAFE